MRDAQPIIAITGTRPAPVIGPTPAGTSSPEARILRARFIRSATPADLPFILHLARRFSNELGFVPKAAFEDHLKNRRILLALENDEPAGYFYGYHWIRYQPLIRPIYHAAVCFDAQRQRHGLQLLAKTTRSARFVGQQVIQAHCRDGLDANQFWVAAGFEQIATSIPTSRRQRPVICWRKLITPKRPIWFFEPPPRAGWKGAKQ